MNESQLSSIKERLMAERDRSLTVDDSGEMPAWEPPRSPHLPNLQGSYGERRQPEQIEAVQALRHRSPRPSPPPSPEEKAAGPPASTNLDPYLRRLYEEANHINTLSQQYEVAIQKFQRTVKGIDFMLIRQGESAIAINDICQLRDAALTEVIQDSEGRYLLRAVQIDLKAEEERAYQTAADVRTYRQSRSPGYEPNTLFHTLFDDPLSGLEDGWRSLAALVGPNAPLTPLDILVWGIGGLIGRKALDLMWAATPALGPWILGVVAGAVVLALYRFLFTQQPSIGFIARLGLALAGLLLGGYI